MHASGANFITKDLQKNAEATGPGEPINCTDMSKGAYKILTLQVTGISGDTITWEATVNGTTWDGLLVTPLANGTPGLTATANGLYSVDVTGLIAFRARVSEYGTGSVTVNSVLTAQ